MLEGLRAAFAAMPPLVSLKPLIGHCMGASGGFPIDLILFGMIAAFLVLRLKGILGKRTGYERPPQPIQPREAISLSFGVKTPGNNMVMSPAKLSFDYRERFGAVGISTVF